MIREILSNEAAAVAVIVALFTAALLA